MSYDLIFAKPTKKIPKKQQAEAYTNLQCSKPGDLFERLPVKEINNALIEAFENYDPKASSAIETDNAGAEVGQSSHHFWFGFGFGGDKDELIDQIVEIFHGFGCPVYDPQCDGLYPLDKPWGRSFPLSESRVSTNQLAVDPEQEAEFARMEAKAAAWRQEEAEKDRIENPEKYKLAEQIAAECAGGRWQRLGLGAIACADAYGHAEVLSEVDPTDSSCTLTITGLRRMVQLKFFEALPADRPGYDSLAQARKGASLAVEYFFGKWRDDYREWDDEKKPWPREKTRKKLDWIDAYRNGLLLALYADDEKLITKLITWPDTDLPPDEGNWNMTTADNQAQMALAFLVRGEPKAKLSRTISAILRTKRKRAMAFASAVQALSDRDAAGFAKHLKEANSLYLKSPHVIGRTDDVRVPEVHIEGSILWHVARRAKLPLPELPERNLDLILR